MKFKKGLIACLALFLCLFLENLGFAYFEYTKEWEYLKREDPMTDEISHYYAKCANETTRVISGKIGVTCRLIISYNEGKKEPSVYLRVQGPYENGSVQVKYRIGKNEPKTTILNAKESNGAVNIFFDTPRVFLEQAMKSDKLAVILSGNTSYAKQKGTTETYTFDIKDIESNAKKVIEFIF